MRKINRHMLRIIAVVLFCSIIPVVRTRMFSLPENAAAAEADTVEAVLLENIDPVVSAYIVDAASIPAFAGVPYTYLNGNVPSFDDSELTTAAFETYSNLDNLGRCGTCYANVGKEIMPTEDRGAIGNVKPTGWKQEKYPGYVNSDPPYLYNRCHLLGFQLTAENANERNLITGTRYMNTEGMLPFENKVADYVHSTGGHVLYRVTPIFSGNNLLASGVEMEAKSVEDNGRGVSFHVFVYNVQPGIAIDYATGKSWIADVATQETVQERTAEPVQEQQTQATAQEATQAVQQPVQQTDNSSYSYVLNKNTKVFHYPTCSSVSQMKEKNKIYSTQSRDEIIGSGYKSCGNCHP